VLGHRLADDGTHPWLAGPQEPLGALAEGLPDASQRATELDEGVAQRTIAADRSFWRHLDRGRPHAHRRVVAMQGRVARIVCWRA
jgi:hypothetical protein